MLTEERSSLKLPFFLIFFAAEQGETVLYDFQVSTFNTLIYDHVHFPFPFGHETAEISIMTANKTFPVSEQKQFRKVFRWQV